MKRKLLFGIAALALTTLLGTVSIAVSKSNTQQVAKKLDVDNGNDIPIEMSEEEREKIKNGEEIKKDDILIKGLDEYTASYYKKFIFGNEKVEEIYNPEGYNLESINTGISSGQLIGGNLSLICSSLGTKYEINTKNKILFLEEVEEPPYKIDRMLTQLKQSGKLKDVNGIVLGTFTNCIAPNTKKSLSLQDVFNEIILPLNKPTLSNLACGHCLPTLTLPLGSKVLLDANTKKIKILE